MTVVKHTLSQPGTGRSWNGQPVTVKLAVNGFTTSGQVEILSSTTVHSAAGGVVSIDLVPNSQIDPTGTYYTWTNPDGEVLSFIVSDATGPLWLRSLLVSNPASPSPVFAGPLSDVATTVTVNGALTVGVHNPIDATTGNRSMTLANASRGGQYVSFSKTDATTNTVALTLNLRGTVGGTLTLSLPNEGILLESKADGSWWPIGDHKTLGSLDGRYLTLTGSQTATGLPTFQGALRIQGPGAAAVSVTDSMINGGAGIISMLGAHTTAFLIHLSTTAGAGSGTGLIGLAADAGGTALLIDNRSTGIGFTLDNFSSITSATAYGMYGVQNSAVAPLVCLQQQTAGAVEALVLQATASQAGQILASVKRAAGTRAASIDAVKGQFSFFDLLTVQGETFTSAKVVVDVDKRSAADVDVRIYRSGGGANAYPYRVTTTGVGSGDVLSLSAGAFGSTTTGAETVVPVISIRGTSNISQLGFHGTAPVVKQSVTGSRGGNAALASLLTALANYGLVTDSSTA